MHSLNIFLENAFVKGIYDENAEEFHIEKSDINNFALSFSSDLSILIENDLHRFYVQTKIPFVFPKEIKASIDAIIYCTPITIKYCYFDKKHFFFEKIANYPNSDISHLLNIAIFTLFFIQPENI